MPVVPDIAPEVFRQRHLIEGRYTVEIDADGVRRYLLDLAAALDLKSYGDPVVHAPEAAIAAGEGRAENAGYDAFLPLVDSGIAAYVWTGPRFFSVVIYTCKGFDAARAVGFTRTALGVEGEMVDAPF